MCVWASLILQKYDVKCQLLNIFDCTRQRLYFSDNTRQLLHFHDYTRKVTNPPRTSTGSHIYMVMLVRVL